ncbi:MAG: Ldh family oxidoreductase [Chloroflexi bacterium]|nr:Ldh family oxidoreductase [Chloroflexota bacterium]
MANTRSVRPDLLEDCIAQIFAGYGLPKNDAATVANTLVQADLRGVHSHGAMRVATYVRGIKEGRINPKPSIKVVKDAGPNAVVDGNGGMGQVVAHFATRLAIDKAKEHGAGNVTARGSRHCGAMAYYAMMMAAEDCIGFATTNAGINMAPWGGIKKLVGNNPFAVAVPAGQPWPMVLDMATSVAAGGKVDMAAIRKQKLPLGWALDANGKPTDDPEVARREGSLVPVGGPKGYGMAVMLDVLTGVLSAGRFGAGLGEGPGVSAHFFQALRVDTFLPLSEFQAEMSQLIDQIHAVPLAAGVERVYLPGEIEYGLTADRMKNGIPTEVPILDQLEQFANEIGATTKPSMW